MRSPVVLEGLKVGSLREMASVMPAKVTKNDMGDNPLAEVVNPRISSETFTKENTEDAQHLNASSSYTLASQSQFSSDVDRWIRGNTSMESTGVQNSGIRLMQRSTLAMAPSLSSGMWYVLAMVLPLFSIRPNYTDWRCNPSCVPKSSSVLCYALSGVLYTAEFLFAHVSAICDHVRNHIRRLAEDQVLRDMFATAMDAVLVVYALGFLILSMYQASIIG